MTSNAEAEKAISLINGKTFMERALIVSEARPQKKKDGEFRGRENRDR
jgi:RNA recognition motif-containing protein